MSRIMGMLKKLLRKIDDISIKKKLLISFFGMLVVPIIIIEFMVFNESKEIIQEKVYMYNVDILNEVSTNIEYHIHEIDKLSCVTISNDELAGSLKSINKGIKDEYLKIRLQSDIENIIWDTMILRNDILAGTVISLNDNIFGASKSLNFDHRISEDEKEKIRQAKGSMVWLEPDGELAVIPAARMIYDLKTQKPLGILVFYFEEQALRDIYKNIKFYDKGEFYIISGDSKIISHKDQSMLNTVSAIGYSSELFSFVHGQSYGRDAYITNYMIENTDWNLISIIPAIEFEKEIIILRNWMILIAVIVGAVAIILSLILSSSISRPIYELCGVMGKVKFGDFRALSTYDSKNEIGTLSRSFNKMIREIDHLIKVVYKQKLLKQKSELMMLRMQINPHFLYNTLESINWYSSMIGAYEIGEMIRALADFMRNSIKGEEFITLEKEIENMNNYLIVQRYIYGENLDVKIDFEEQVLKGIVPRLIIQPLVENSIVHGIEEKGGKGEIVIKGKKENGNLLLFIKDNGAGMEVSEIKKLLEKDPIEDDRYYKVGLVNVEKRVKLYYGPGYGLDIQSTPGAGTLIKITIPLSFKRPETYKADETNLEIN